MGLLNLFVASSMPVLKVLLVTAVGSFLALDHVNLLSEDARKHINTIVFYVLNPALIIGNLANSITYDSMVKLWFMPINVFLTFLIGSLLGWLVNLITRPPPHLRGLVIGCCAAGNLGNILIIIVPAVCKEKGSPFGNPSVCTTDGLAYASLSMAMGAIFLWVYVYNIVRISVEASSIDVNDSSDNEYTSETTAVKPDCITEPLLSPEKYNTSEDSEDSLPCTRFDETKQLGFTDKVKQNIVKISRKLNVKRLFAPSTNGAIVGFIVGLVPMLRNSMIGDEAPLRVIEDSTMMIGDAAVPVLTLIIGANLLKGLRASGVQKSMVIGIIVARYIALPIIGTLVVRTAVKFNLVHADPLYQFVLLLQFAVPPAMNMGTITQLFGKGESECSVIMLWTYVCATISLTLWCTYFMWLVA
ncbi:Auxin efflux carrier [Heracleum sosnowskyi]|uniref:Auxin efflux carrier n=1 Tax=Heracleum sosnowskyi TaxID=360622 RepID=A0AAD8JD48_9APIA|nr:Auxin efflux carrier [Heracleum sosnowskyi]